MNFNQICDYAKSLLARWPARFANMGQGQAMGPEAYRAMALFQQAQIDALLKALNDLAKDSGKEYSLAVLDGRVPLVESDEEIEDEPVGEQRIYDLADANAHGRILVEAGKIEGDGERNYKFNENFHSLEAAQKCVRQCQGYHFIDLLYVDDKGLVWNIDLSPAYQQ